MSETNKVPLTDDWFIGTDGMNFILLKRRVVQGGPNTKKENIGRERYDPMGYYPSISALVSGLYRYLSIEALMKSEVATFEDFILELNKRLESIEMIDRAMVNKLKEQMGVSHE